MWLSQNDAADLSWDQDSHKMFIQGEGKGMVFVIF